MKIIIADDQPLMRDGLATLLGMRDEFIVVATASDGHDLLEKLATVQADVVLMDIRMPNLDGVEATKQVIARYPDVKVLMLTTFNDYEYVYAALNNGASGYLLKDMPLDVIAQAVFIVAHGGVVLPPDVTREMLLEARHVAPENAEQFHTLTERELDVLRLLGNGLNNREIAEQLFITEGTVKNHVSNVITKLSLRDRTQAAIYAVKHSI